MGKNGNIAGWESLEWEQFQDGGACIDGKMIPRNEKVQY
jgi:hypothetical protein